MYNVKRDSLLFCTSVTAYKGKVLVGDIWILMYDSEIFSALNQVRKRTRWRYQMTHQLDPYYSSLHSIDMKGSKYPGEYKHLLPIQYKCGGKVNFQCQLITLDSPRERFKVWIQKSTMALLPCATLTTEDLKRLGIYFWFLPFSSESISVFRGISIVQPCIAYSCPRV